MGICGVPSNLINFSSNKTVNESLKVALSGRSKQVSNLLLSIAKRSMMEAQYVCAGLGGYSHYGLGVAKYTHFTSPIRRYSDLIVHRMLLAAGKVKLDDEERGDLVLPSSKEISVLELGKEREEEDEEEIDIDDLLGGSDSSNDTSVSSSDEENEVTEANETLETSKFQLVPRTPPTQALTKSVAYPELYTSTTLAAQCIKLNRQTRNSKTAAQACQTLFLSLFFLKNQSKIVAAVVVGIRENGLVVFVPEFDFRGGVHLGDDSNSQLRIDEDGSKLKFGNVTFELLDHVWVEITGGKWRWGGGGGQGRGCHYRP